MSFTLIGPKKGGTNGSALTYTCPIQTTKNNQLLLLFAMCCSSSFANIASTHVSDTAGLTWQGPTDVFFPIDANGRYVTLTMWRARAPIGPINATATLTWNAAPGTCSIFTCAVDGVNINAPFDPNPQSTATGQNPTNSASQATASPVILSNVNDLILLAVGSTVQHTWDQAGTGYVFLADNPQEPAVGSDRSDFGLYYAVQSGPTTTTAEGGSTVGRWSALAVSLTDGVTPPPIFRARSIIIQ